MTTDFVGGDRMVVGFATTNMQLVPSATDLVCLNHYVIKVCQ